MFTHNYKKFSYLLCVIVIIIKFRNISAELEECNKIIIEGGSQALQRIFADFSEMKIAINNLKSSIQECRGDNETKTRELPQLDIYVTDSLPQKCVKETLPKDCAAATACTQRSGIYKIQIDKYSFEPFYVECDADTENGDWLLIQRRHDGSVDFSRNWEEYEKGFGDVDGEFFIGLKKLYALTNYNGPQELLILMEDANSTAAYAKYDTFAIGNDTEMYKLKKLGKFTGSAGDSLKIHLGMKFTTKDRDNDIHATLNCAAHFTGAWWHAGCHHSNLNGKYGDNTFGKGINWKSYRGHNASLKYVKIMIRRRRSSS
ncbi:ryncolin-4-like [Lucilia sericata]|uniref:ryncolin-4-like n=1 Tax=Lucilia sericata TaxID=13632 RepID=UPI0018A82FEE|nr:ryncolin-4-like [Lucilia sericata]